MHLAAAGVDVVVVEVVAAPALLADDVEPVMAAAGILMIESEAALREYRVRPGDGREAQLVRLPTPLPRAHERIDPRRGSGGERRTDDCRLHGDHPVRIGPMRGSAE